LRRMIGSITEFVRVEMVEGTVVHAVERHEGCVVQGDTVIFSQAENAFLTSFSVSAISMKSGPPFVGLRN
jgi:hypothetical protein